jgi:hypothetical protein
MAKRTGMTVGPKPPVGLDRRPYDVINPDGKIITRCWQQDSAEAVAAALSKSMRPGFTWEKRPRGAKEAISMAPWPGSSSRGIERVMTKEDVMEFDEESERPKKERRTLRRVIQQSKAPPPDFDNGWDLTGDDEPDEAPEPPQAPRKLRKLKRKPK